MIPGWAGEVTTGAGDADVPAARRLAAGLGCLTSTRGRDRVVSRLRGHVEKMRTCAQSWRER